MDKIQCASNLEKYKNFLSKTMPEQYLAYANQKKSLVDAPDSSDSKKLMDATYTILSEPVFLLSALHELSSLLECIRESKNYTPDIASLFFPNILNELSIIMTGNQIIKNEKNINTVDNESAVLLAQLYDKAGRVDQVKAPQYTFLSKIRFLFFPRSIFRYSLNKELYSGKPLSSLIEGSGAYNNINILIGVIEDRIYDCTSNSAEEILSALNKGFYEQKVASEKIQESINQSSIALKGIDSRLAKLIQISLKNMTNPDNEFLHLLAINHPKVFTYNDGRFFVNDSDFFYNGKTKPKKYKEIYATISKLKNKGLSCPKWTYLQNVVVNKDGEKYGESAVRQLKTNLSPLK